MQIECSYKEPKDPANLTLCFCQTIQNKAVYEITTFLSMDILGTQRLSECCFLCHMFRITVLKQQTSLRKKSNKQDFVLFLNSFSSISALYQKLFCFQIIQ